MRLLLLITVSLFSSLNLRAQDTTVVETTHQVITTTTVSKIYRNAISTNGIGVLGLIVSPVHRNDLTYERAIGTMFSVSADIEGGVYSSGGGSSQGANTAEKYKLGGWGFGIEGRIYPTEKKKVAPRGFFTGLYYKHFFLNESFINKYNVTAVDEKHQAWGVGLDLGYKLGKDNFMFEPIVGYAMNWNDGVGTNKNLDPFYADSEMWTMFLRVEARLGVVF